jgi:hypothetical protein
MPGGSCDPTLSNVCMGMIPQACIALSGGGGACLAPCFLDGLFPCSGTQSCHLKTGPEWSQGICAGQETPCDVVGQTGCGATETCVVAGGQGFGGTSFYCDPNTGSAASGESCMFDPKSCSPGLACSLGYCASFCDPAAPNCAAGTCQDDSLTYGLPEGSIGSCH